MQQRIDEIDLHIVDLLALCSPGVVLFAAHRTTEGLPSPWWLFVLVLLPQGRILVHSMDLRSSGDSAQRYLIANECFGLGASLVSLGVWLFVSWLGWHLRGATPSD